jgi:uncharacterized protein YdhG (YjbR/CyaY superfamily)
MPKTKSPRSPGTKSKRSDVDKYLAAIPASSRDAFHQLRIAIRSVLPDSAEEIISYRIPAFRHNGRIVVWFAAFAKHCSLFPTAEVINAFKAELKGFSTSKGTIQFPLDKPIPTALIKKIVKARLGMHG